MVRGSTPTFFIKLPTELHNIASLTAVFIQEHKNVLSLDHDRFKGEGKEVSFTLSEEETLLFSFRSQAELQLKLQSVNGSILISDIKRIPVKRKYPEDAGK